MSRPRTILILAVGALLTIGAVWTVQHHGPDCHNLIAQVAALKTVAENPANTTQQRREAGLTAYWLVLDDHSGCATPEDKATAHARLDSSR